jgi:hypothetical protein
MALKKQIKEVQDLINDLDSKPGVNWLGKWAKSIQRERLVAQKTRLENKLQSRKNKK